VGPRAGLNTVEKSPFPALGVENRDSVVVQPMTKSLLTCCAISLMRKMEPRKSIVIFIKNLVFWS